MKQTKEQIEAECDKITDLADAKCDKIRDLAWAEYNKTAGLAYAEKERKLGELEDMTNQTKQTVEDEILYNYDPKLGEFLSRKGVEALILKAKDDRDKEILEFAETVAYRVDVGDKRTVVASSDLIDFLTK